MICDNSGVMTPEQIESLKSHFQEWSGGFPPESPDQVTVYVDYARDSDLDPDETREVLLGWMEQDAAA